MAVRYITVTPVTKLFKPAIRAFGDIAIVGDTDTDALGPKKTPTAITNPDNVGYGATTTLVSAIDTSATTITVTSTSGFPSNRSFRILIDNEILHVAAMATPTTTWTVTRGTTAVPHALNAKVIHPVDDSVDGIDWFKGNLGKSIRKSFEQTPGPTTIWAVSIEPSENTTAPPIGGWKNALAKVENLDVQIVALANMPLKSASEGKNEIEELAKHVSIVSKTGGDGKERIGVAMLEKTITDPSAITTNMSIDRMVMVAHKSDEDVAAAVAGTIAGYEPHISLLLKQVKVGMDQLFSDAEMEAFDKARVNWLTDPSLLPGKGLFMGEAYTLGTDMPYIDIVRTVDDISFRLKAALIRSIGNLRVSRSGLRALESQMTAVLEPLKQREVIEGYEVFIPLKLLLDKKPAILSDAELQQINNAQNDRTVQAIVAVDYAGAIHRLNITLKFV